MPTVITPTAMQYRIGDVVTVEDDEIFQPDQQVDLLITDFVTEGPVIATTLCVAPNLTTFENVPISGFAPGEGRYFILRVDGFGDQTSDGFELLPELPAAGGGGQKRKRRRRAVFKRSLRR